MIEGEREMRQESKDILYNMEEMATFIKYFQIGRWNCWEDVEDTKERGYSID